MCKHDIGDAFKDRVKGYVFEVDTDEVWKNLDLNNDKKKKRFIPWLWGLSLFILLVGAGSFYFINQNHTHDTTTLLESQLITSKKSSVVAAPTDPTEKTIETQPTTTITTTTNPTKISNPQTTSPYPPTPNSITPPGNNSSLAAPTTAIAPHDNAPYNQQNTLKPPTTNMKPTPNSTTNKSAQALSSKSPTQESSHLTQPLATLLTPLQKLNSAHQLLEQEAANSLALLDGQALITIDYAPETGETPEKKPEPIKPQKQKLRYSLNLYTGIYTANRKFNTQNADVEGYLLAREKTEKSLEMINVGTALRIDRNKGPFFEIGLEYQSINERFQYVTETRDTVFNEDQPTTLLVDSFRDTTVLETGPGYTEILTRESWKHYNSHQIYMIPISLGYEISRNKFSLHAKGTFLTGLRKYKGMHLIPDGEEPAHISDSWTRVHGARLSAGISYALLEQLSVSFSPSYQTYLSSFVGEDLPYTQKYQMFGLQVGMTYNL